MAINTDIIGKTFGPVSHAYGRDDVILYALGIGAGTDEIDFIYEKNLKVFPTFAAVRFMPIFLSSFVGPSNVNLYAVLHGEHKIIAHGPIPVSGTVHDTFTCDAIHDKGDKGALFHLTVETRDENGALLFENKAVFMDRSAGNFGGERGPKAELIEPPGGKSPDFRVEHVIPENQAALYRLSGDKNPLHIDPEFAAIAGFDRPILHGLCSFGHAGRAVLRSVCDGDPARLKSLSVRFVSVAFPGDTLVTEGWRASSGRYLLRTVNQDGKIILGNAVAEVSEE